MRRPFKGEWFYEWQIGPYVFQLKHSHNPHYPRVNVWRDPYWKKP